MRSAAVLQRIKRRKVGHRHKPSNGLLCSFQTAPATCETCSAPLTRPWTCLTCPLVGCLPAFSRRAGSSKDCLGDHWLSSPDCHFGESPLPLSSSDSDVLGIDPSTGSVWCSECSDIHHLSLFERAFDKARLEVEEENDMSQEASALGPGRGRKRGHFHLLEHPPDPSGKVVPCSGESILRENDSWLINRSPPAAQLIADMLSLCHPPSLPPQPVTQGVLSERQAQPTHVSQFERSRCGAAVLGIECRVGSGGTG